MRKWEPEDRQSRGCLCKMFIISDALERVSGCLLIGFFVSTFIFMSWVGDGLNIVLIRLFGFMRMVELRREFPYITHAHPRIWSVCLETKLTNQQSADQWQLPHKERQPQVISWFAGSYFQEPHIASCCLTWQGDSLFRVVVTGIGSTVRVRQVVIRHRQIEVVEAIVVNKNFDDESSDVNIPTAISVIISNMTGHNY